MSECPGHPGGDKKALMIEIKQQCERIRALEAESTILRTERKLLVDRTEAAEKELHTYIKALSDANKQLAEAQALTDDAIRHIDDEGAAEYFRIKAHPPEARESGKCTGQAQGDTRPQQAGDKPAAKASGAPHKATCMCEDCVEEGFANNEKPPAKEGKA